jgi:hypothetical protein
MKKKNLQTEDLPKLLKEKRDWKNTCYYGKR